MSENWNVHKNYSGIGRQKELDFAHTSDNFFLYTIFLQTHFYFQRICDILCGQQFCYLIPFVDLNVLQQIK